MMYRFFAPVFCFLREFFFDEEKSLRRS